MVPQVLALLSLANYCDYLKGEPAPFREKGGQLTCGPRLCRIDGYFEALKNESAEGDVFVTTRLWLDAVESAIEAAKWYNQEEHDAPELGKPDTFTDRMAIVSGVNSPPLADVLRRLMLGMSEDLGGCCVELSNTVFRRLVGELQSLYLGIVMTDVCYLATTLAEGEFDKELLLHQRKERRKEDDVARSVGRELGHSLAMASAEVLQAACGRGSEGAAFVGRVVTMAVETKKGIVNCEGGWNAVGDSSGEELACKLMLQQHGREKLCELLDKSQKAKPKEQGRDRFGYSETHFRALLERHLPLSRDEMDGLTVVQQVGLRPRKAASKARGGVDKVPGEWKTHDDHVVAVPDLLLSSTPASIQRAARQLRAGVETNGNLRVVKSLIKSPPVVGSPGIAALLLACQPKGVFGCKMAHGSKACDHKKDDNTFTWAGLAAAQGMVDTVSALGVAWVYLNLSGEGRETLSYLAFLSEILKKEPEPGNRGGGLVDREAGDASMCLLSCTLLCARTWAVVDSPPEAVATAYFCKLWMDIDRVRAAAANRNTSRAARWMLNGSADLADAYIRAAPDLHPQCRPLLLELVDWKHKKERAVIAAELESVPAKAQGLVPVEPPLTRMERQAISAATRRGGSSLKNR